LIGQVVGAEACFSDSGNYRMNVALPRLFWSGVHVVLEQAMKFEIIPVLITIKSPKSSV
jgi:hypothetical protein